MTDDNVLRPHAEQLHAAELAALVACDRFERPPRWAMSPRAVVTYLLGGTASDGTGLVIGRAVVGVGCAASFMSVVFLCARWFAPRELATALSWVFAASNIGTLAAATPLAWIAATVGWRNGFVGLAAVTVSTTTRCWRRCASG